jgi:uncharacterized SAM-binding protein YcdF (DUF218 family)
LFWWFKGESILSLTERVPAEVLVVEGWIGLQGIEAAKVEFDRGGYLYIVTAGGIAIDRWNGQRRDYARDSKAILLSLGVPVDKVIEAPAGRSDSRRTFDAAVAVRRALESHQIRAANLNVFTMGTHARRSRLVYAKALYSIPNVGVVSWAPLTESDTPWWNSSQRAGELLKETIGWLFEALLNSGRTLNAGYSARSDEDQRRVTALNSTES